MAKKKLNVIGIVFAALILVGLVLAIVGMCTPILSNGDLKVSVGLFDEEWSKLEKLSESMPNLNVPSRTFTIIAFVVLLIGAVVAVLSAVLDMIGKGNKFIGLGGGAVAVLGGILVLIAGLVLASDFTEYSKIVDQTISAGAGIWLGFIGGLLAGVPAILGALKVGQK
ncbi:MAG: hypothetical protein J1F71_00355 [Clostridiales bacterium]|nr:hypothetical protein [Clostridiales bacterium]